MRKGTWFTVTVCHCVGTIDEIEGTVDIRHVAPRVLTPQEIAGMKQHVEDWMAKVDGASALLEAEGVSAIDVAA